MADTSTPAARVSAFLTRFRQARGLDPDLIHGFDNPYDGGTSLLASDLDALLAERDAALDKIENAMQSMSETQPSWERRCHAIMSALGLSFGGPTPDIPEQSGWYARNLKLAEDKAERLRCICADLRDACADLAASLTAAISLLERGGEAVKKAAPSNGMFDMMLQDYKNSLERTRVVRAGG